MKVQLTVTEGPHTGMAFTFDRHDTFLIGRSPDVHFSLPNDPYFSRYHFLIEINPPLCRLTDMRSHNHTFLNGNQVEAADLRDGDEIRAGRTVFRVSFHGVPAQVGVPQAPPHQVGQQTLTVPPEKRATIPPEPGPQVGPTAVGPLPGTVVEGPPLVPGYPIIRELGRGGMGVVYLANCEATGSLVALKTILPAVAPSDEILQRFLREAQILQKLQHPHIVSFRDMGHASNLLYFVMDYVDGQNAEELLITQGAFTVPRATTLTCQLLEALEYAHGEGIVHRDIKPANLLITREGGREIVRLADFGLARTYQGSTLSGLTMTGRPGGTPAVMPPEQITDFRSARPAADQYAVGATLYLMLANRPLYDHAGGTTDLFLRILKDEPTPLQTRCPDLPRPLVDAIHKALARKPEDRFADARSMRQALLPFCEAPATQSNR